MQLKMCDIIAPCLFWKADMESDWRGFCTQRSAGLQHLSLNPELEKGCPFWPSSQEYRALSARATPLCHNHKAHSDRGHLCLCHSLAKENWSFPTPVGAKLWTNQKRPSGREPNSVWQKFWAFKHAPNPAFYFHLNCLKWVIWISKFHVATQACRSLKDYSKH